MPHSGSGSSRIIHVYQSTQCNCLENVSFRQRLENPKPCTIKIHLRTKYCVETSINAPSYRKLKIPINVPTCWSTTNVYNTFQREFSLEYLMENCIRDFVSAMISLASNISYEKSTLNTGQRDEHRLSCLKANCLFEISGEEVTVLIISAWKTWLPMDEFLWNFIFEDFSKPCSSNFNLNWNLTIITRSLHEDLCTFMIISRWVIFRMRNVSNEICRENQNTQFMFNSVFFSENRAVCETMWKNVIERDRPQMTI
jgi:hypothetical protein